MSFAEDYVTREATALAALVRQRQVSPAELVEAAIERLQQMEPKLTGMAEWTVVRPLSLFRWSPNPVGRLTPPHLT